jgi:hypothetical protein
MTDDKDEDNIELAIHGKNPPILVRECGECKAGHHFFLEVDKLPMGDFRWVKEMSDFCFAPQDTVRFSHDVLELVVELMEKLKEDVIPFDPLNN